MTEVPEHLLRRSQERRAALGLGGEGGGPAPAAAGGGDDEPGNLPARAAASDVAAPAAAVVVVEEPPAPLPPYVQASMRRPRVPTFAIPVLAALPIWAFIYAGAFAQPPVKLDPVVAHGKTLFLANCAGCHGAVGQGGTGRPLGTVLQTFPKVADHLAWVHNGSPAAGTPYGDPNRPGGQRLSQSGGFGAMPAFKDKLSDEDIAAIVRYEREVIGGEDPAKAAAENSAAAGTSDTGGNSDANQAKSSGGNVGSSTTTPK